MCLRPVVVGEGGQQYEVTTSAPGWAEVPVSGFFSMGVDGRSEDDDHHAWPAAATSFLSYTRPSDDDNHGATPGEEEEERASREEWRVSPHGPACHEGETLQWRH